MRCAPRMVLSALAVCLWATASEAAALRQPTRRTTIPFDGQYIQANVSNTAVEWWYVQVVANPTGDNPPANVQALFYQGYPLVEGSRTPLDPEYYITINGMLANGTTFNFNLPASTGTVTATDEEIYGSWDDVGTFHVAEDLSSIIAEFSASDLGISGSMVLDSNTPHHFACNTTVDAYFDSVLSSDMHLNSAEEVLFKQLGWAITIPSGSATVNLDINGTTLEYTGNGYHDANWLPVPLNDVVSSWYFFNAQVGPFAMSGVLVKSLNSTRQFSTGYLSESGVVLQNQCSIVGSKTTDISTATPFGEYYDSINGETLPEGFTLNYTLASGDEYSFNLTSLGQNPDQLIYHRWIGVARGGKTGGAQYEGTTVFEWLNPGMNVYVPQ